MAKSKKSKGYTFGVDNAFSQVIFAEEYERLKEINVPLVNGKNLEATLHDLVCNADLDFGLNSPVTEFTDNILDAMKSHVTEDELKMIAAYMEDYLSTATSTELFTAEWLPERNESVNLKWLFKNMTLDELYGVNATCFDYRRPDTHNEELKKYEGGYLGICVYLCKVYWEELGREVLQCWTDSLVKYNISGEVFTKVVPVTSMIYDFEDDFCYVANSSEDLGKKTTRLFNGDEVDCSRRRGRRYLTFDKANRNDTDITANRCFIFATRFVELYLRMYLEADRFKKETTLVKKTTDSITRNLDDSLENNIYGIMTMGKGVKAIVPTPYYIPWRINRSRNKAFFTDEVFSKLKLKLNPDN